MSCEYPEVAQDIMTRSLVSARPDQDLWEAERLMMEHQVTGLPVLSGGRLAGIVSRSDVARMQVLMRALDGEVSAQLNWDDMQADGFQHAVRPDFDGFRRRIDRLQVKDAMRDQVVTCGPSTPITEVAAEMVRHHIHRLIVVQDGLPVGVISSLDLARLVAQSESAATCLGGEAVQA